MFPNRVAIAVQASRRGLKEFFPDLEVIKRVK